MLTNVIAKVKQFAWHFFMSLLILLGLAGFVKYHLDMRARDELLYKAGRAGLVISHAPKKTLFQKIVNKHVLVPPPQIPTSDISNVVQVVTTTGCPTVTITVLDDGTVVSNSPGVTNIINEDYNNTWVGEKLGLRLGYLLSPKMYPNDTLQHDISLHAHYFRFWQLYPETALTVHSIGLGLAYKLPKFGPIKNTYISGGLEYRWDQSERVPYAALSLGL